MPPKRASTTEAPTMTQDAIRKLVADSVTSALEAQAATMASASNPNRNTGHYWYTRSIKGNVTASKPQTLEEAINIAQRLMDQLPQQQQLLANTNNRYNNRRQQNRRQEAGRAIEVTSSEQWWYMQEMGHQARMPIDIEASTGRINSSDSGFAMPVEEHARHLRIILELLIVFIDDILIYSKNKKEHEEHLRYVVPTGKDKVIVSVGRAKVIPAGGTILVLVEFEMSAMDPDCQEVLEFLRQPKLGLMVSPRDFSLCVGKHIETAGLCWSHGDRKSTTGGCSIPGLEEWCTSSKKSKSTEAPKSDVPADSQQPSVEVSSQKATIEDVEVPSNPASTTQHTGSSFKKVGIRKKRLGQKGVHPSHSTIPIEDEDPEAEHKMCLKYASDADSASDDDTPVNLHAVVDWELLPTGLGWINVIYRKDNSRKCFTSLREILHLVTRADLMTIYGRVMTFYQDKQAAGVGLVLWGDLKVLMDSPEVNDGSDVWKNQHTWNIQSWKLYSYSGVHVLETVGGLVVHMFVDKKYPLSVNLIERMLDHQLEICQETVGNELTTAVQLIAFLKKQIADSRRPKLVVNGFCFLENLGFCVVVFMLLSWSYGFAFQGVAIQSSGAFKDRIYLENLKLTCQIQFWED
ncbi:hypothetical protein Tco_1226251 [Tanacetum coccineum]